jgi:polo-like kinase 4
MQIIKVFNKSYDAPSGILSSKFITKNKRKITLILSDSNLYRIVKLLNNFKSEKGVKFAPLTS